MPDDLNEEFRLSGEPQSPRNELKQDFRPIIERIARSRDTPMSAFTDFIQMAACALALQTREEEYLSVAKNYSKEELLEFSKALGYLVSEMEGKPFTDILGPFYLEIGSKFSRDLRGEFYTPKDLGDAMAQMLVDVDALIEEGSAITVSDPASGSGGLVLSLASKFAKGGAVDLLRVTCQDVSKTACDMAYINTTLWGVPAKIIHGDTLRRTIENIWINAHWARVGEPQRASAMALEETIRIPVKGDRKKELSPDTRSDDHHPVQGLLFD